MSDIIIQNSLADRVYDLVKSQILSGELVGGMTISELSLGQRFGVSRTPIREALRRLAEYGLVVLKARCNATVYEIDEKEAADIARVRLALEQLAVECIDKPKVEESMETLYRLATDCQYFLGVGNRAALFEKDSLFHLELVKCAGNSALYQLFERLDAKVQLLRIAQNLDDARMGATIAQHLQILQVLKADDRQACKTLLREHILHECRY
ncbi:GntR family transcriptional regulator [Treponema sp.]